MTIVIVAIGVAVALIGAGVIASIHTEELRRDNEKMMNILLSVRTDIEKADKEIYKMKSTIDFIDESLVMQSKSLEDIKKNTTRVNKPRRYKI